MNLSISSLGLVTLYIITGSFAALVLLLFSLSATTPFYTSMITAAQNSPVISLLATLPFVILLGILVDTMRILVVSILLRRNTYRFDSLSDPLKSLASFVIAQTLRIDAARVQWRNESQFVSTRQILLPSFDQYKIHERWLHDLFLDNIFVSAYALLVVASRRMASPFRGVDWLVTVICLVGPMILALRLESLEKAYTAKEVCLLIHQGLQADPKDPSRGIDSEFS